MSLLIPDSGLLFWMLLSFGIVAFVLCKYGFPVILKMVEKRKAYIEDSILAAKQANQRLATIQEESEAILVKARQEQTRILNETTLMREHMLQEAKEKALEQGRKMIEEARQQIQLEKNEAIEGIRREAVSLSVAIAEKVLLGQLENPKEQELLIGKLLDEMSISKS